MFFKYKRSTECAAPRGMKYESSVKDDGMPTSKQVYLCVPLAQAANHISRICVALVLTVLNEFWLRQNTQHYRIQEWTGRLRNMQRAEPSDRVFARVSRSGKVEIAARVLCLLLLLNW